MKPIIGINNPYGLILKGGKKKLSRKNRTKRKKHRMNKKTRKNL